MTRLLLIILAVEAAATGWWASHRLRQPAPPELAGPAFIDPETAVHLRELRATAAAEQTADAWLDLGQALAIHGRFAAAEQCCRRAAQLSGDAFLQPFWWGITLDRLGETEQAVAQFTAAAPRATGTSPSGYAYHELCYHFLGRNYLRMEDARRAEAAFRQADSLPLARYELAKLLLRTDRPAEARQLLDKLVAEFPQHHQYYFWRARALSQLNRAGDTAPRTLDDEPPEVWEDWDMLDRAPESLHTDLLAELMIAEESRFGVQRLVKDAGELAARGDTEQAAKLMSRALAAEWLPTVAARLAAYQLSKGRTGEAELLIEELFTREGAMPVQLDVIAIGDHYQLAGQPERAVNLWGRLLLVTDNVLAHSRLANFYLRMADAPKARYHRTRALYTQATQAFRANRLSEARAGFQEALQSSDDFAPAWYYLGETQRLAGDAEAAREALQRCLQLDPDHGRARRALQRLPGE